MTDTEDAFAYANLPSGVESEILRILDGDADPTAAVRDVVDRNPELAEPIAVFVARYRRAESDLQPHTRYGPYRVLEVLGEGGMGVVYRAVDDKVGREVALKCMKRRWIADASSRRRFEREVAAIARLDHPSICRLLDYGEDGGTPYFAMQLVDGASLDRVIRAAREAKPLPHPGAEQLIATARAGRRNIDAILVFVQRLLAAVEAAHARGLVHRDIKPANVMVDSRGTPVVLDFGLVRDQDADDGLTLSDMVMGTPGYMAPEQITKGFGAVGPRTDLHAVGLLLYEVIALVPAYRGTSLHELQQNILRREQVPLGKQARGVSRDLQAVVDCATATAPARRYVGAAEFAEDLRRLRAHEPIHARRPGLLRRALQWSQRNTVGVTVLLALTAGLLLTGRLLWVTTHAAASTRRHLDRFFSLAVAETLREAGQAADALYPASPENAPRLAAWLERYADPLAAELPRARAVLEELTATSATDEREEQAASTFLARTLTEVVPRLELFLRDDRGVVADVRRRLQWASTVAARSFAAESPAWAAAVAAVTAADGVTAHPGYAGMGFVPQVGLLPLGMDPRSRLWEFYDLASAATTAAIPSRDDEGRISMQPDMGLVFVLVPGGTFAMGASVDQPPNLDPQAEVDETPVCQVTLAPFLLSKFEMTQAQWLRLTGQAPSYYKPAGNDGLPASLPRYTMTNPVESVAWSACAEVARRQGWALPTEAQWEYACRAGTSLPFSFGAPGPECGKYGNVADATAARFARGWQNYEPWEDGHVAHAPVGSFAANAFGLHDMHGNVLEFCADWKLPYAVVPAADTGSRPPPDPAAAPDFRVARGGCYYLPLVNARSADRHHYGPDDATTFAGWRPLRPLDLAPVQNR